MTNLVGVSHRCVSALGALAAALGGGTTAWAQAQAQAAARPEPAPGPVLLILVFLPALLVAIILFSLVSTRRTAKRNLGQIDRSLRMTEETQGLIRQQVALQAETNRLLAQLIEAMNKR